jgi:hypothetical protein
MDCFTDITELDPGASRLSVWGFDVGAQCAAPGHRLPALQAATTGSKQLARPKLHASARTARKPPATRGPQEGLLEGM